MPNDDYDLPKLKGMEKALLNDPKEGESSFLARVREWISEAKDLAAGKID